jgi:hypothetical protein
VSYNPIKKLVVIDVGELFNEADYPHERIEEIFEKMVDELAERFRPPQRPKEFRGDSFSASVPIKPCSP